MMKKATDDLVYRMLRKKSLADTSMAHLEDLVKDYPYFSLARYLLARKALETSDPRSETLASQTALFIPDTPWLDHVLYHDLSLDEHPLKEPLVHFPEMKEREQTDFGEEEETEAAVSEEENEYEEEAGLEILVSEKEPIPVAEEEWNDNVQASQSPAETKFTSEKKPESGSLEENTTTPPQSGMPEEVQRAHPQEEQLKEALSQLKKEADAEVPANAVIPMDPYHSIDYFASQGIRLRNEDLNKDQIGRQMKKFTEWLKTMKRIPATESAADIDEATNQNIQNIAAHSIAGTDIVTEAMAEVLVKQKNFEKAVAVYKKLSLQNPAKSTYFASLIEDLNKKLL